MANSTDIRTPPTSDAQKVLIAYASQIDDYVFVASEHKGLAAAILAVADLVVPPELVSLPINGPKFQRIIQRQRTRAQMLALAAELEGKS